jgi:hypothetical protein
VNRTKLCDALERDIYNEMSVSVKLDLQINRIWLTDKAGRRVYTEAIGVQCASESSQIVVGGLKAILNDTVDPPTGRKMYIITRSNVNEHKETSDILIRQQRNIIRNEKTTTIKPPFDINKQVTSRYDGKIRTIQQLICKIETKNGEQLFLGVEKMGSTENIIILYTSKHLIEARRTIKLIGTTLTDMVQDEDKHIVNHATNQEENIDPVGDREIEANYLKGMVGKLYHFTDINVGAHKRPRVSNNGPNNPSQGTGRPTYGNNNPKDSYSTSMDGLTIVESCNIHYNQWTRQPSIGPYRHIKQHRKERDKMPEDVQEHTLDTDMSDMTASQLKTEIMEHDKTEDKREINIREEMDKIIKDMNQKMDQQINEQNKKVDSIEKILQEMANERKSNNEREINKEKVAIQQYRQSMKTEEEVQAVYKEV